MFALHFDRERFYAHIDWNTAKNLAIAENLSPQDNFRLFLRLIPRLPGEGEEPEYEPYSRFPIGSFALIKAIISPFGDNIGAAVFAGRMLMLAFFSAAAFLAFRSIDRSVSNRWIALTAVLIAFSSYYILMYANQVSNEMMIGLFGMMLAFHGMVIFVQEDKFLQLLFKVCVALLLDWHVYAMLAPFIALGLGSELIAAMKAMPAPHSRMRLGPWNRAGRRFSTLARSRYSKLGGFALVFGAALLAFNLINEYHALNGRVPLTELPSVASAIKHGSLRFGQEFPWGDYLISQVHRIGIASIPYALTEPEWVEAGKPAEPPLLPLALIGAGAALASLVGALFAPRQRLLLGTLALSGFCWMLPMRSNAFSEGYEGIYWIGVPLTLVALLLLAASGFRCGRLLPGAAAAAALPIFMLSAAAMIANGPEAEREAARHEALFSDFENIRKAVRGKSVVVAQTRRERRALYGGFTIDYLLAGSRIRHFTEGLPDQYDFVLIPHHRDPSAPLLTPENEIAFLYGRIDPLELRRTRLNSIISSASEQPAARSGFDIHLADGALVYIKEPCGDADFKERFFLRIFSHSGRIAERRKFDLSAWSVSSSGKCAASVPLPNYPIEGVRTGQFSAEGIKIWTAAFSLNPEARRADYESVASVEPDARAVFNIYMNEKSRTLIYAKEPCDPTDVEPRFFLHVVPERKADLPDDRRMLGFENRDFDFRLRGAVFDGKCAASVPLPEYPAASIRTGQWIRGEGELWDATVIPLSERATE